jgi:beta-phosphoglucomutase
MYKDAKAYIFDLNGTIIDDMRYHEYAWLETLQVFDKTITPERVHKECYGKNEELLERIFTGTFTQAEKIKISHEKEARYKHAYKPNMKLIDGLYSFLSESKNRNIPMAIGSAAITTNIDFIIDELQIRHFFKAIVSADDVEISKPHPETFLSCANKLGVLPANCLVFEDSAKGITCAANAGMKAILVDTMKIKDTVSSFTNIIRIIDNYTTLSY